MIKDHCYICSNITYFNVKFINVHSKVEFNLWMNYLYTKYKNASKQNLSEFHKENF